MDEETSTTNTILFAANSETGNSGVETESFGIGLVVTVGGFITSGSGATVFKIMESDFSGGRITIKS